MEEEFNLSEKEHHCRNRTDKKVHIVYDLIDVKEFIRIILDYGERVASDEYDLMREIIERAGDKLK